MDRGQWWEDVLDTLEMTKSKFSTTSRPRTMGERCSDTFEMTKLDLNTVVREQWEKDISNTLEMTKTKYIRSKAMKEKCFGHS